MDMGKISISSSGILGPKVYKFKLLSKSATAKLWKEPRCPSTDKWIKKMWSIYTMEYYSAIRNDEYPTFASTWMGLEEIMLREISQAEKVNYHMVS